MRFDPIDAAAQVSTAAQFEQIALDFLARVVGCDVAFMGLRGASMTARGLASDVVDRAVQPGGAYEAELAPVKQAALAARGVAVDTDVLGEARVTQTAYFRDLARPLGGKHSLLGYLVLRGRVIGGVMLGRTGAPFGENHVARVADLLPTLAIARASYGLPGLVRGPLPARGQSRWRWRERGLARREAEHVELRVRDKDGFREMVARHRVGGGDDLDARRSGRRCQVGLALHRLAPRRCGSRPAPRERVVHWVRWRHRAKAVRRLLSRHPDRRGRIGSAGRRAGERAVWARRNPAPHGLPRRGHVFF